ncbi:MAG: 50S ribosomal protein L32 [Patescibacteria group bacterium]|nr:50S ribosomal protein L32 [Patescibacteria group bacterium]
MAKHPVPHQKLCKGRSTRRYKSFANRTRKKLSDKTQVVTDCPSCGDKVLSHHLCESCGKYRGVQVINKEKESEKITTIKA